MNIDADIRNRQVDIPLSIQEHVIVIGVGGIGSWVALDVALSGQCENLYIIDPDTIESSNLNRTPFRICDITFPKVDAIKYLILERRSDVDVYTFQEKTSPELTNILAEKIWGRKINEEEPLYYYPAVTIIDCRDDVYEDMYPLNCKYFKLGYDGLSITIDGNPRETKVWGHSDGYNFVPSFVAPSQLIASLVVIDIFTDRLSCDVKQLDEDVFDDRGMFNTILTVDTERIIEILYNNQIKNQKNNKIQCGTDHTE